MRHRLLHTLVFSSSFLLDGCAIAHGAGGDAGTDASSTPDAPLARDALARPDAFEARDAFVAPDAFEPPADAADARACGPGWPTTKGSFEFEEDGVWYNCGLSVDREDPDLSLCCVIRREAP